MMDFTIQRLLSSRQEVEVRMVLVPATMELLGDRNWWLPRSLQRILLRVQVGTETVGRHDPAVPATARELVEVR